MSAELLRRAATLLRHTAGAAQIGQWFAETPHAEDEGQAIANGAYIALMHPPVALALADWLDLAARAAKERRRIEVQAGFDPGDLVGAEEEAAVAVARAILREPAASGEAEERSDTPKEASK